MGSCHRLVSSLALLILVVVGLPVDRSLAAELDVERRVALQAEIERFRQAQRDPAGQPTRVFEATELRAIVMRSLRYSAALERYWDRSITPAMLRGETRRIESSSRLPQRLLELYTVLGNDATAYEETIVRRLLGERLIRGLFATKPPTAEAVDFDEWWDEVAPTLDVTTVRVTSQGGSLPLQESSASSADICADGVWSPGALDDRPEGQERHTAVWTGAEMIIWGGAADSDMGFRYDPVLDTWNGLSRVGAPESSQNGTAVWTGNEVIVLGFREGGRYDPASDTWSALSTLGAPSDRFNHTAVWTGSHMLIWGGRTGSSDFGDGAAYDPGSDSWSPISDVNAPSARYSHRAHWTGSEMLVWGGWGGSQANNSGGRYNPSTDTWTTTSVTGDTPSARSGHTSVWTGSEMIVWGGGSGSGDLGDGASYSPATDTWAAITTTGAPSPRADHTAVWDGTRMIVWGGESINTRFDDGARYDPATDSWAPVTMSGSPRGRDFHTAVWDGSSMLVFGGRCSLSGTCDDGSRYDPAANSWTAMATGAGDVRRDGAATVWTGYELIVWGGLIPGSDSPLDTGIRYDPTLDSMLPITLSGAPLGREGHKPVWTGREMIFWGGGDRAADCDAHAAGGGRYDPALDQWTPMTVWGEPVRREFHTAVWTGTEMLVWGGCRADPSLQVLGDGGAYDPASDSWRSLETADSPVQRFRHSAVWTGGEMIVWGGDDLGELQSGGRYDPVTGLWSATNLSGAPKAVKNHAAVWTGDRMIVWGGSEQPFFDDFAVDTGGIYDPSTDAWLPTPVAGAPAKRELHGSAWTGTEMLVWGGLNPPSTEYRSGGRYNPDLNSWTPIDESGAPTARTSFPFGWTGEWFLIAGGQVDATGSRLSIDVDGDGEANICDIDDDNDGVLDGDDCAPNDASLSALPAAADGLTLTHDSTTRLQWTAQPAAFFDIAGGVIGDLIADGGSPAAICLANQLEGTTWEDWQPDPAAGSGYYYLVRTQNDCGSIGFGAESGGQEREAGAVCP